MNPIVIRFALVAGAMDVWTGALLLTAPAALLRVSGTSLPGGEDAMVLLRWIGIFVGSIGLSYLWAIATRDPHERRRRVPGVWGATAIVRAGVALFCSVAILAAQLPPLCWWVAGIDGAVALAQVLGARRGWVRE